MMVIEETVGIDSLVSSWLALIKRLLHRLQRSLSGRVRAEIQRERQHLNGLYLDS